MSVAPPVTPTISLRSSLPSLGVVGQHVEEAFVAQIYDLLQETRPEFRSLQITSHHGTVTLQGRVASYYLRQLAVRCCQQAAGVFRIDDQLSVGAA